MNTTYSNNNDTELKELLNDLDIREEFRNNYIEEVGIGPSEEELNEYMIDTFNEENILSVTSNNNDSPFSKLFGFFFLLWFFGSIIGMIYYFDNNPTIGFMIFGQCFFVFGLLALFSKVLIGLLFAILGLGFIIIPILLKFPDILPVVVNWEFLGVLAFGLAFSIAGLILFFLPFIINKSVKKRCTNLVSASVIKVLDVKKIPVYEYNFNNRVYKVKGNSDKECYLGENVQLMINPDSPREVYYKYSFKDSLFFHLFSLPFIASGIFVIIVAILEFL